MKNQDSKNLAQLRLEAQELEEEFHDLPGAVEAYGKAAAMGDLAAMKEILRIGEENAAYIQDEIVNVLVRKEKISEDDLDFVKVLSLKRCEEIPDGDVVRLLDIACKYCALDEGVESLSEWLRNSDDAMRDPEWIFPDGHDDGESIDELPCDDE